ncbi:lipoate--protein ligase family protein [bacterium]|nr:lipoate--protein ligase family protein [bacterium]
MDWLPLATGRPAVDLAFEEALLEEFRASPGTERVLLRTWVGAPAVVIGRSQDPRKVVHIHACKADGVGVYRRCSGGGAVIHDSGNLNITLVLDRPSWRLPLDPRRSFAWCARIVTGFLAEHGLETGSGRISDITAGPRGCAPDEMRKVSGTAQARRGRALLWHATLLLSMPVKVMDRYLPVPADRLGIPHSDYAANLASMGVELSTAEAERGLAMSAGRVLERDVVKLVPGMATAAMEAKAAADYPDLSL